MEQLTLKAGADSIKIKARPRYGAALIPALAWYCKVAAQREPHAI